MAPSLCWCASLSPSSLRPVMTTAAPCRPSARATARPMPRLAPVTRARRPVRSNMPLSSGNCSTGLPSSQDEHRDEPDDAAAADEAPGPLRTVVGNHCPADDGGHTDDQAEHLAKVTEDDLRTERHSIHLSKVVGVRLEFFEKLPGDFR